MIPSTFDQPLLICFTDTDEIMEAVLNGRFLPLAWENARAQRIFTLFYSLLWDQIHHITSISIHIHQNIINHFGRGSYLTNENIWHHDNSRCPWCPCPWGDRFRRLKVQIDPKLHVEAVKVGRIVGLGMWWWNGYGGLEDVFFFWLWKFQRWTFQVDVACNIMRILNVSSCMGLSCFHVQWLQAIDRMRRGANLLPLGPSFFLVNGASCKN